MLRVQDLAKSYVIESGERLLFSGLSFDLAAGGRLAIIGRNGQGKSTLIKILGGVVPQSHGRVDWSMTCSWPLGFTGGVQGGLTGLDNIRFLARIYDRPIERTIALVEEFAELGKQLRDPVKYYSSGMRARLAFGLSLAIEFDCYLIDEVFSIGDMIFQSKCEAELFDVRAHRTFIMASHDMELLRTHCDRAIIVERGRAKMFDDISVAIDIYSGLCEDERRAEEESIRG